MNETFENSKNNQYLIDIFGSEKRYLQRLISVDFFHALSALQVQKKYHANYIYFPKEIINEFIEEYLRGNSWTDEYKTKIASALNLLLSSENHNIDIKWKGHDSKYVIDFINKYNNSKD